MPKIAAVDAYIKKSKPFSQPILKHLRDLVHTELPHAEEVIKWGLPYFMTHGTPLANMGAFKEHATFGLWKAPLLKDPKRVLSKESGMGHFGRLASLKDLPSDKILRDLLQQADKLNADGGKVERKAKPAPKLPPDFKQALSKNKKAAEHFKAMSPSAQRAYVDWLLEAKTDATRERRLETALQWIFEGKTRTWKYERK